MDTTKYAFTLHMDDINQDERILYGSGMSEEAAAKDAIAKAFSVSPDKLALRKERGGYWVSWGFIFKKKVFLSKRG